jgi:hypothetical protein
MVGLAAGSGVSAAGVWLSCVPEQEVMENIADIITIIASKIDNFFNCHLLITVS